MTTCARCERPLSDTNAYRRKTRLCQRCSAVKPAHTMNLLKRSNAQRYMKHRTGLRNIATILKGLPVAVLFLASTAFAQVGPAPGVQLQDEGTGQGRVQILNCVGSGVACTKTGVTGTVTISGGGSGYATIQEEGASLTQRAIVNFIGSTITCVDDGSTKTNCTLTGGGGSANTASVTVDFGTAGGANHVQTVVTGQAWVTASSVIVCSPTGFSTADRQDGAEDAAVEGLTVSISGRVAGTGFTLNTAPIQGNAIGKYLIGCTGA